MYCGATNDEDAELCAVCGQALIALPKDYELKRPKAELKIPAGQWVEIE